MGRTFHFECPHCQYRAHVSGGADGGLNCTVLTISCRDCHQLYDVFTRLRLRDNPEELLPATVDVKPTVKLLPQGINIPPLYLMENSWNNFSADRPSPGSSGLAGRRAPGPVRRWYWTNVKPVCPVTAAHRIEIWRDPGRCPRCGNFLEKNGFPFRRWD